jgi:hypothetical protein
MKKLILCLLISSVLLVFTGQYSAAATYKWVDANGVMHFSDNPESVPLKYRNQAKDLDPSGSVDVAEPPAVNPEPVRQPDPSSSPQEEAAISGKGKDYWKMRFSAIRLEQNGLKGNLEASKGKLAEARHKWLTTQRRADRQALNQIENDMARDESRIKELDKKLEDLDAEATRSAVPFEWRQ